MAQDSVLVCQPGDPWTPWDLANMWEKGIVRGNANRLDSNGQPMRLMSFTVNHYADSAAGKVAMFIDEQMEEVNKFVTVIHQNVDPRTCVCQSCGTTVGQRSV